LGLHIGDPVSQNRDGHVLGHVKDIGGAFNDMNDRAGYKSRARLPFHTDVGADVVGLLCLEQGTSGGRSHVANALALHNAMLEEDPEMVRLLSVPLHRDRRGEHLPGKGPTYRAPVFAYHAGYMTVTYVRRFIDSAPRHPGVAPLSAETIAALDRLEALCESDTLRLDMEFRPGDIQWINNLVTFHGRGEFADGARQKRHLLRLWLQIPEGWPLPDCHYERFGEAGDPGRPRGLLPPGTPLVAPLDVE
jgi:hypothetical protein